MADHAYSGVFYSRQNAYASPQTTTTWGANTDALTPDDAAFNTPNGTCTDGTTSLAALKWTG